MKYILRQNKPLLAVTVLFSILSSASYVYIARILQRVTDTALSRDIDEFFRVLILSAAYFIVQGVINYAGSVFGKRLLCGSVRLLRKEVFDGVLRRNAQDFSSINTADYLSAFTNDIKLVEDNYILQVFSIFQYLGIFIGTIVFLFVINWAIALCMLGCLLLLLIVPGLFGKALQKRQDRLSKSLSEFTVKVKDILSGYEVIKSYRMDNRIGSEFDKRNDEATNAKYLAEKLITANESVSEVLAYMTIFSGFFVGAYLIIIGSISAGTLLALIQLSSSFVNPLMVIMQSLPRIKGVMPVLARLEKFAGYTDISFSGDSVPSFERCIEARNLGFSYNQAEIQPDRSTSLGPQSQAVGHPNHGSINDRSALAGVSLKIAKNKKYAIVGESGCGKSTLIRLLAGSFYNYEGEITYDGKDIRDLDNGRLRNLISVIHQNIYMFDDSIRENICLYDSFAEEQLNGVLETSGVKRFLDKTQRELSSPAGENGNNLSGGQRQKIAVARALIRNKPIMILDEGTASIDMQAAYDIESSLLKIAGLTLITVTHNMSRDLLGMYDRIVFMENGAIAETGTLDQLLELKGGFHKFFHLQKEEQQAVS